MTRREKLVHIRKGGIMEKTQPDKYVSRKEFYYALGSVYTMLLLIFTRCLPSLNKKTSLDIFATIFLMGVIAFVMFLYIFKASKVHD